jgi:hypothetical protein
MFGPPHPRIIPTDARESIRIAPGSGPADSQRNSTGRKLGNQQIHTFESVAKIILLTNKSLKIMMEIFWRIFWALSS